MIFSSDLRHKKNPYFIIEMCISWTGNVMLEQFSKISSSEYLKLSIFVNMIDVKKKIIKINANQRTLKQG